MKRSGRFHVIAALATGLCASGAFAAETRHVSEYSITLGILPIARASFATELERRAYRISGHFSSAGIVDLLADISADTSVNGTMRGDRFQADRYSLVYKTGKKVRTYNVDYQNGNVTNTTVKPEPKARPNSWVPVTDQDLRAVLDPISGLIFPASSPVCPGRVPIYDGESRMDLVLSANGTRPFSTKGFKGDAIVCNIRYVPKSGYRKGREDIEYLRKQTMEVWFAKADSVNAYAPVYARIPTRVGQVYVTAVKYGD